MARLLGKTAPVSVERGVASLLVVAFLLRLGSNFWLTVPVPNLVGDAQWYHQTAVSLASGQGYIYPYTGLPTAAWPPGYSAILAVSYRLFGPDPGIAFLLNALAGTATCYFAGLIARALWSPAAQLVATGLLAFTPSHVLFSSLVMSEIVFTMTMAILLFGGVVLVGRTKRVVPWGGWLAWGAAAGLASLIRAEAAILLAAPFLVFASSRMRVSSIAGIALVSALGLFAAQLPWLARNASLFGKFVPVSTGFGRTFLIGHNPVAEGDMNAYSPDPAADQRDLARGGPALELEVDNRLRDAGLAFMLQNPASELRLIGKRFYSMYRGDRVWGEWYVPSDPSRVSTAAMEALGKLSNLYYGALILLAAPTFLVSLRRPDDGLRLLSAVLVIWTVFFVVVLYGSQRFHFPLMPVFCVLAAGTVCRHLPKRPDAL